MFLRWLSLLPLPHNYTTHSKALDSKICQHEVVQWRLSRQRSEQNQSTPLPESSVPPEGCQRTWLHAKEKLSNIVNKQPTSERWLMKTHRATPLLDMLPMMTLWVCTHNTARAWRDTAQGSDGTQVLPETPSHGKFHGKTWTPSLVLNLQEPFCHLHILINNSYLHEFLSNSKSQKSQCLHLNIGASHLSKQSHLCLWEGCSKHDLKLSVQILLYKQNLLSQRFFQLTINYYLSTEGICYRNHEN